MSQSVSAQFWFIIDKKILKRLPMPSKNGHSQTGSCIFATDHMSWSGATSCK